MYCLGTLVERWRPANCACATSETMKRSIAHNEFLWIKLSLPSHCQPRRDKRIRDIQEKVHCSLKIVSRLMLDLQKKTNRKFDRKQSYDMLTHVARLLMASHKDLPQQRRQAIRPAVNTDFHILCDRNQNTQLQSNEYLFGEDIAKRADDAIKTKRLTTKIAA